MEQKKLYHYTFKHYDRRGERVIARAVGVVKANSREEAEEKINEIFTDYDGNFEMEEIEDNRDLYIKMIYKL